MPNAMQEAQERGKELAIQAKSGKPFEMYRLAQESTAKLDAAYSSVYGNIFQKSLIAKAFICLGDAIDSVWNKKP